MTFSDMLEISIDNPQCVIFTFKAGVTTLDKIASGIFVGNEEMIRVTKGQDHELRVYKTNDDSYAFHWGDSGFTLISERLENIRKLVCQYLNRHGVTGGDRNGRW